MRFNRDPLQNMKNCTHTTDSSILVKSYNYCECFMRLHVSRTAEYGFTDLLH